MDVVSYVVTLHVGFISDLIIGVSVIACVGC